jgi:hypothetical protein
MAIAIQDLRECELNVGQSHDHVVDHTTEVTGQQTERDTEHSGQGHGRKTHQQRNLGPVQHPTQDVPAQLVGAQQESRIALRQPGRRLQP